MSNYLMKYKGIYRLKTPIDLRTNTFPREYTGQFAENDVYIDCKNNIQIYHYGRGLLQVYSPSLQRGNNIIKAIKNDGKEDMISDIERTDTEVLFRFHSKYMKELEQYLKPRTYGASISPYSIKNLPKDKSYKIPEEDLAIYKEIMSNIPQHQMVLIGQSIKSFLQTLVTKKNTWEDIKADMAVKGLRGKEYIHCIGQWDNYLDYLRKELEG